MACFTGGSRILIFTSLWLLASADMAEPSCKEHSNDCLFIDVTELSHFAVFRINDTDGDVAIAQKKVVYDCSDINKAIDDESLPKLDHAVHFENVSISNCIPPTGMYKEALKDLNITGFRHLQLWFEYCTNSNLFNDFDPDNFENLNELETLDITCVNFEREYLDLSFLRPLENLKHLTLVGMKIPPMPSWNRIPSIELDGTYPLNKMQSWGGCDNLETLIITYWTSTILVDGWLANCPRLISVHLRYFMHLRDLPQRMINSTSLTTLKIIGCSLFELPQDLLAHVPNLRVLHLTSNALRNISRSMLSSVSLLEDLNLSNNGFQLDFLPQLAPLKHLRSLSLDSCLGLSDNICMWTAEDNEKSVRNPWPLLPSLEYLSLQNIVTENICRTWSQTLPSLKLLNLTDAHLTELRYEDIQFIQMNNLEVDLRHSKFEAIVYGKSDYKDALKDLHPVNIPILLNEALKNNTSATLWLDTLIDCDCRWYWFARVLQERPDHFRIQDLQCRILKGETAGPVPLKAINLESLVCESDCEPGCKCYRRTHDHTTEVNCTGAELAHVPRLPRLRKIHMANNRIEELHINYFSKTLEYMDLQYNQLSVVEARTASVMFSQNWTRYRLEGNPIICACNNSAFIDALQRHHNQIIDYDKVTCVHGQLIKYVSTNTLCLMERAPVIAGVFGSIAILILIALAVYYRYQHQIHVMLYAWGWRSCCVTEIELDKDKIYDVFVSYAFDDSTFVMDELLPGLEKKPHAFKVCVHYRDWTVGEWIPTQIAQSVKESRRTIIVLSKNFLSSIWSLLEFRTAHIQAMKDGRARLIVVLLEDVINHSMMDDEMRAYLTSNTYIKWGDPRFWNKLRYALPHQGRDERRLRAAGEEVVRLMGPSNQQMMLSERLQPEPLCIAAAPETE